MSLFKSARPSRQRAGTTRVKTKAPTLTLTETESYTSPRWVRASGPPVKPRKDFCEGVSSGLPSATATRIACLLLIYAKPKGWLVVATFRAQASKQSWRAEPLDAINLLPGQDLPEFPTCSEPGFVWLRNASFALHARLYTQCILRIFICLGLCLCRELTKKNVLHLVSSGAASFETSFSGLLRGADL